MNQTNNQTQEPTVDQIVDARFNQRTAITLGGIMLDKIRAEEEVTVLKVRLTQAEEKIAELEKQLKPEVCETKFNTANIIPTYSSNGSGLNETAEMA